MRIQFQSFGVWAYKVGDTWITFSGGKTLKFERLGQFIAYTLAELAQNRLSKKQSFAHYALTLN